MTKTIHIDKLLIFLFLPNSGKLPLYFSACMSLNTSYIHLISRILQYLSFCNYPILRRLIPCQIVKQDIFCCWKFFHCIYISWFPHMFIKHWICFYILAIMSNGTINMKVQIPLRDPVYNTFDYIHKSRTADCTVVLF